MSHTIVLGGGLCGLTAAMMLARDGQRVTVLERDPAPVPADAEAAWERWRRDGVAQFRQAHYLQPLGRSVLEAELPDVLEALQGARARYASTRSPRRCRRRSPTARRAPATSASSTWTARRSTLEWVVARAAEARAGRRDPPRRRRDRARDAPDRRPRARQRRAHRRRRAARRRPRGRRDGPRLRRCPKLLAAAGGDPVHEESEDTGFLYYTRYFRGEVPEIRGPLNMPVGTFSILTLPGDNGTWSVTLYASAGDRPLKALRDPAQWTALVRACPRHAHWLDGEPITAVMPMGGVVDRLRSPNGSAPGRCGLVSASATRGRARTRRWGAASRSASATPRSCAGPCARRRATRRWRRSPPPPRPSCGPWYDNTVLVDRARMAEIVALRSGERAACSPSTSARASAVRSARP